MRRFINFSLVFLLGLGLFTSASPVFAQITPTRQPQMVCPNGKPGINSELGCIPTDVGGFVAEYYGYGLSFIGGLAIMIIMYGGFLMIASQGNPIKIQNGKTMIGYALIGLILAVFGYVFTEAISCGILKLPGFCT